jgi:short-subunit dehydrogenase
LKKTSLIIGGASGIGRCLYKIISENEKVIIWDKKKIQNKAVDVASEKLILKEIYYLKKKKIKLDNIFICHGVHHSTPLIDMNLKELKNVFENNFFSYFLITKHIRSILNKNAKIIAISSISACTPIPYSSSYSSSKAALEALYFSYKNEERNFFPVIVQPGNVNTGFNETGNNYKKFNSQYFKKYKNILDKINSKFGMDPNLVAKKIYTISQKKTPKFKYIIGKNAILANIAKRILGDEITLKLLKYYFKI